MMDENTRNSAGEMDKELREKLFKMFYGESYKHVSGIVRPCFPQSCTLEEFIEEYGRRMYKEGVEYTRQVYIDQWILGMKKG